MATMKVCLFLLTVLFAFVEANVLRDLQTIRHNEHFPYFFAVSRCTLCYVLVTQLLFYRTAEKRDH